MRYACLEIIRPLSRAQFTINLLRGKKISFSFFLFFSFLFVSFFFFFLLFLSVHLWHDRVFLKLFRWKDCNRIGWFGFVWPLSLGPCIIYLKKNNKQTNKNNNNKQINHQKTLLFSIIRFHLIVDSRCYLLALCFVCCFHLRFSLSILIAICF